MNNTMRNFVLIGLGFIGGCVVTNLVMKEHYKSLVDEEIESIKETFGTRGRGDAPKYKCNPEPIEINADTLNELSKKYEDKAAVYNGHGEEVDCDVFEKTPYDPNAIPYLIDPNQYNDEEETYEKLSFYYHRTNSTLLDENGEIESHIMDILGEDVLTYIDQLDNADFRDSAHTIYVRNDKVSIDYEIVILNNAYESYEG